MNDTTTRGLLVAGLAANVLFLMLGLLDYSLAGSKNMWPLFVGWAFVILLMVIVSLAGGWTRRAEAVVLHELHEVQAPERVVAKPAPKPEPAPAAAPTPVHIHPPAKTAAPEPFPFTYNGYTLYSRDVELKGGGQRTIWFFAKHSPKSGTPSGKPAGYHVGVNERTGLPFLKRGKGADGEDLTPNVVAAYRPQCSALTEEGHQCRNSARHDSKYCASHFGYQPPAIAKAAAAREDTTPRVKGAPDTKPSVRRSPA